MILASDDFKRTMRSSIASLYVRIELLDGAENVIESVTSVAIDGSIDVDKNRDVQRQFNLTLLNDNNAFTWSAGGRIWLDKRVRLYISYDNVEWVSLGVFLIDEPIASSSHTGERIANLSGGDKWRLLDGNPVGKFTYVTTIPTGTPISEAIQLIARQAGIDRFLFDPCDVTVPYVQNYDSGMARGQAMKILAEFANYDLYFDPDGYLRFRPKVNYEQSTPTETYDKSEFTMYAGSQKRLDTSDLYNKVLVVGGNNMVGPVSAVAVNDDPNSPISTVNIGERLYIWRGDSAHLITTPAEAQMRADYELQRASKFGEIQEIEILPNYLHEADDVIRLVDDWTDTDDNYVIERFNIPLKPGEYMRIGARRVISL